MTKSADPSAPIFEIHHDDTIIRIADDWSGHVLIEQIYDGLRQARRLRDDGRPPSVPPAPGTQAANAIIEAAEFHGFQRIEGTGEFKATTEQIMALVTTVREGGLEDVNPGRAP